MMITATEYHRHPTLRPDTALRASGLSVRRALGLIAEGSRANYQAAWNWFLANSGKVGKRLYGERLPGVSPEFAHCALRGIHVPANQRYALSVTSAGSKTYAGRDGDLVDLHDGTWLMFYSAHVNNTDGETQPTWNNGLLACLADGVPVGVFLKQKSGDYLISLAFVEEYVPGRDSFVLHGPADAVERNGLAARDFDAEGEVIGVDDVMRDLKVRREAERVVREGQARFRGRLLDAYGGACALSGCRVPQVLQAAHIVDYSGAHSNLVQNGLLLRSDLHLLYDSCLISVEPETLRVVASENLLETEYARLDGMRITPPKDRTLRPRDDLLDVHHRKYLALARV